MKNLIIHNPTNEYTKNYRSYNNFFDDLTEELKKKYNVKENRFFENSHFESMKVKLKKRTFEFLEILECEYIIEDDDTGEFYILSVSDQISSGILKEQKNPYLKKVLYSQYIPDQMVSHCKENVSKYYPWIYFPIRDNDYNKFYKKRLNSDGLISKMYFKGSESYRPIVNLISENILSDRKSGFLSPDKYFEDICNYKIALSIGGAANGDICYRDVECMAMGIPLIRFDFVATLNPGLIPNYHYISIPLPPDLPIHNDVLKDRLGELKHAKLIEKRFNEIINNDIFLNFISKNAKEYYEKYLSEENRVKHTLKLLEL
jgi:hypothetical protein